MLLACLNLLPLLATVSLPPERLLHCQRGRPEAVARRDDDELPEVLALKDRVSREILTRHVSSRAWI